MNFTKKYMNELQNTSLNIENKIILCNNIIIAVGSIVLITITSIIFYSIIIRKRNIL